jgi:hypothetical protein
MKNIIKILCLILLATFNLSTWAAGRISTFRPAQPPQTYRVEPVKPIVSVDPNPYRLINQNNTNNSKPVSPSIEPLTAEDWKKQLKNMELLSKTKVNPQKEEFMKSGAIKCEGNVCEVTRAGHHLLNPENKSNYAQKFQDFCRIPKFDPQLNLEPTDLQGNN